MPDSIKVFAPATVANVGCGYDILGFALEKYGDTITLEEPIVLENILYDFDDDRIKKESESDLTVVLGLLNQPKGEGK